MSRLLCYDCYEANSTIHVLKSRITEFEHQISHAAKKIGDRMHNIAAASASDAVDELPTPAVIQGNDDDIMQRKQRAKSDQYAAHPVSTHDIDIEASKEALLLPSSAHQHRHQHVSAHPFTASTYASENRTACPPCPYPYPYDMTNNIHTNSNHD